MSGEPLEARDGEEVVELEGRYLSPGFIDLHAHGALGRDTMEATEEAFGVITKYHASGGTTSLALTTVAAPVEKILDVLKCVERCQGSRGSGARVIGAHIEGPYFSREKPGAHRLSCIHDPEPSEYERMLEHRPAITRMTLAPELPGALELIDRLSGRGIGVSGGHSNAWDEEAEAAFHRGMTQVTHTFNCMSSARRRGAFRVAGLVEFAMSEPRILCELIADGRHVSPTLMRMLYRAKGADGICLVTDATAGAGLPEGRMFQLGELECVVRDDVGMTADGNALAGSTANMIRLVRNMVEMVGAPLHEAIRMATLNAARGAGLEDRRGCIREGYDADLVVLSTNLEVWRTFVAGERVF